MQVKFTLASLVFFLTISALQAQTPKDATVPVAASVETNPASITLSWPNPSPSALLIQRRLKTQSGLSWTTLLNVAGSTLTSYTDYNVTVGQTYEYYVRRTTNINAHGYAHVAVEAPLTDSRGKVILFVDADIMTPLSAELERLRDDLAGDGWQIVEHIADTSATIESIKNQIVADYNAAPTNVKSVLFLGKIPVPYSGNSAWDGHTPDHTGAWPCDAFYADLNGTWTDATINNTAPTREANKNVPGDLKFDQNFIPSAVELQVGRVDFRRLTQGTFGATTTELLKRYLDKNHAWRTGTYIVENKALVDDNFGYFGGEAFAANGFRNAYPLVGEANVIQADFFNNTNPQTYLMGYGTGGGSYTSAGGVGNSTNFATDTVNIVFSNLFGSYHGDWDFETNPFMPSALASRGGILTCSWAGRPHHFFQALASGETVGFCMKETQNAQLNNGYFNTFGKSGAHIALLGDPTLRAHIVAPPTDLTAVSDCGKVELKWTTSADTSVVGYHVYRAFEKYGAYTRLTSNAVSEISFTDNAPVEDTLYYQIRAVKLQSSPGGGTYWNSSTGAMASIIYKNDIPNISAEGGILTCDNPTVQLDGGSTTQGVTFMWTGPDGSTSFLEDPIVSMPGTYVLRVVAPTGCSSTAAANVAQAPELLADYNPAIINCDGVVTISVAVTSGTPPFQYFWSNGETTQEAHYQGGVVSVTITDANGCTLAMPEIIVTPPPPLVINANITDASAFAVNDGSIELTLTGGNPPFTFLWNIGATTEDLFNIYADIYFVMITDAAGCTSEAVFEVGTTSNASETAVFQELLLSPNPTSDLSLLSIKMHKSAPLKVIVHDAAGRLVFEKPEIMANELTFPIDLKDQPPGIYTVFIFVEKQVFVRKLAVMR